ncbi:MAG TPA: hypothetical protein PKA43_05785 [Candidatus Competibacter phosphatis]|nr:hypothetical protein [Candidatus Competibacter phosphatis]HMR02863.1 hypothetical protein [Candidatus Competibacter phosphatis]
MNVISKSSFGGSLPGQLIAPAFFCNRKKILDALQQNRLTCSRHREMSFFSTPSFGGYLPEPASSGFFYARDPNEHKTILVRVGNFPGKWVP